jgi:hypothetical protein
MKEGRWLSWTCLQRASPGREERRREGGAGVQGCRGKGTEHSALGGVYYYMGYRGYRGCRGIGGTGGTGAQARAQSTEPHLVESLEESLANSPPLQHARIGCIGCKSVHWFYETTSVCVERARIKLSVSYVVFLKGIWLKIGRSE